MSYIGKNPKVDSVKLTGTSTAASGTDEGQLYYNTGAGSISKGLKVYKNGQFVAIDKQLGDADTFHLLKASDIATAEFSAARNSTSTSFLNQNSVPFETSTASGVAGTFSNSSTGDALLTDESADLVFAYKSSGSSDDAQEYFGIPLSIPKAFRGENVVLSFQYRTGYGTGTTATVDGDFEVSILDKSTGNGGQTTSTNSTTDITAGSAITVASKTGLAVGQRIRLEAGSQSTIGNPDATVVEAYITEVSGTANEIKISEDWDTPHASGAVVVSGWLTDVVPGQLLAADSQTDKQGKKFSIQFKTEDDTSDIVLFFQNKNTSSTISRHLFVDNILLSANKFLQASSRLKSEEYRVNGPMAFGTAATKMGYFSTINLEHSTLNELGTVTNSTSDGWSFQANQRCSVVVGAGQADSGTGYALGVVKNPTESQKDATIADNFNSNMTIEQIVSYHIDTSSGTNTTHGIQSGSAILEKGDKLYINGQTNFASGNNDVEPTLIMTVTADTNDVIILESQDEIFSDWTEYTPTIGGSTATDIKFFYRRTGSNMDIRGTYDMGTIGTGGSAAPGSFTLPTGFTLDTSKMQSQKTVFGRGFYIDNGGFYVTENARGWVMTYNAGGTSPAGDTAVYYAARSASTSLLEIDNLSAILGDNNRYFSIFCSVPVRGYSANFNPLLSMPLVDIGNQIEEYRISGGVNDASTMTYRPFFDSTFSTYHAGLNTIDKLGVVDNNSTNGWNFKATQNIKITATFSSGNNSAQGAWSWVKTPSDPVTFTSSTNHASSATAFDGYRIGGGNNSYGAGQSHSMTVALTMKPGEYLWLVKNYNGNENADYIAGINICVEKDFSNTNMAHIIKPAVAYVKDIKAQNTAGGTFTSGDWRDRDLNTIQGESWFIESLSSNVVTLKAGTYKFSAVAPCFVVDVNQLRLYDNTNSSALAIGVSGRVGTSGSDNDSSFTSKVECVATFTSSTGIKLQHRSSGTRSSDGFGTAANFTNELYASMRIEKLK